MIKALTWDVGYVVSNLLSAQWSQGIWIHVAYFPGEYLNHQATESFSFSMTQLTFKYFYKVEQPQEERLRAPHPGITDTLVIRTLPWVGRELSSSPCSWVGIQMGGPTSWTNDLTTQLKVTWGDTPTCMYICWPKWTFQNLLNLIEYFPWFFSLLANPKKISYSQSFRREWIRGFWGGRLLHSRKANIIRFKVLFLSFSLTKHPQ